MSEIDTSSIPEKYRPKARVLNSIQEASKRYEALNAAREAFKRKTETEEDQIGKEEESVTSTDNDASGSPRDILFPRWSQIEKIDTPQESSSGVSFITFKDGRRLVIKSSSDLPTEYWTMEVLSEYGILLPRRRVLGFHEEEYKALKSNVSCRLSNEGRLKFYSGFQRPFIMVMEFAEGTGFFELDRTTGPASFNSKTDLGCYNLYDLGRVIGADVLMNNFDRAPLVWGNEGNGGNIMFGPDLTGIIAIDSKATCIREVDNGTKRNIENYYRQVDIVAAKCVEVLKVIKSKGGIEAVEATDTKLFQFERVGNFLNMWTLSEITPKSYCYMILGIVETWSKAITIGIDLYEQKQQEALALHAGNDWNEVWKEGLALNLDFLAGIFSIIQLALLSADDEVTYAKELVKELQVKMSKSQAS